MSLAGRVACWAALFVVGAAAGSGGTLLWMRSDKRHTENKPPERWEATVYLPVPAADTPAMKEWDEAVAQLAAPFGGATLGAEAEGLWRAPDGKVVREKVRPVIISFEPNRLDEFRRLVDELGRRYKQEEVYVRYERPRVELRQTGGKP